MLTLQVLSFALSFSIILAQSCDFVQYIDPGRTYTIESPNFPASYPRGATCRWILVCPSGYNCRMDCPIVQLPSSCVDRMLVSRTGDPQLYGATTVCGNNPFTVTSLQQRLSVGLLVSTTSPGGRFQCQVYAVSIVNPPACRCGERKQNRIVGGEETRVNEYRMMAGIYSVNKEQVVCGAVIISNRHVLTAAHCMTTENINSVTVLVGDHDVRTETETSTARKLRVQRFYFHPQYNPSNYDYDACIVETATEIEYNDAVGPVCLPFKYVNYNFTNSKVTILGWGTIGPGEPVSRVLRKVDVDVISQPSCRAKIPAVTDRQICTFTPNKDACQFDSGGPLLYTDPTTGLLFHVGIVSYGRFCAGPDPGVNTRVTQMLDWIVSTTRVDFCRI